MKRPLAERIALARELREKRRAAAGKAIGRALTTLGSLHDREGHILNGGLEYEEWTRLGEVIVLLNKLAYRLQGMNENGQ